MCFQETLPSVLIVVELLFRWMVELALKVNRNSKQTLTKLYRMWQSNLLITATASAGERNLLLGFRPRDR